jgi:PAS domain S-box-containing protein
MSRESGDGRGRDETEADSDRFGSRFYRAMFAEAPNPMLVADADGRAIVEANGPAAGLLGYSRSALRDMSLSELQPPEREAEYRELFERFARESAESAAAVSIEGGLHLRSADGEEIPVDATARSFTVDGDRYVVGVFRDLRTRERRDRTLERLHGATRDLLSADSEMEVYAVASRTATDILGLPLHIFLRYEPDPDHLATAAISEPARELFPDVDTFERGESVFWRVFETGEPVVSGDIRGDPDVLNPETPIRSECLMPLGKYGVFAAASTAVDDFDPIDVSLAKVLAANTEAALRRREHERELRERARQLRTVVDNAPVILFAIDADGVFTLSEGRALERIGLEPGEVVGDSIFEVYGENEDILANAQQALDGDTVQATNRVGNYVFDTWYRPIVQDGAVRQVIGTSIDVSERHRRERLLRVLNRFLRHNLRNVITVILGNADANARHDDPDIERRAERIFAAGQRLDRLTSKARRLIDMIDLEEDHTVLELETAIARVVSEIERDHDVTVDVSVPGAPVEIEGFVSIGVRELLENAIEHGTGPVSLVAGVTDGDTVELTITDQGPGLPEQEQAVLVDGDETPLKHGSGFGLFIANWVIMQANGRITIPQADTDGTTITLSVPAVVSK